MGKRAGRSRQTYRERINLHDAEGKEKKGRCSITASSIKCMERPFSRATTSARMHHSITMYCTVGGKERVCSIRDCFSIPRHLTTNCSNDGSVGAMLTGNALSPSAVGCLPCLQSLNTHAGSPQCAGENRRSGTVAA